MNDRSGRAASPSPWVARGLPFERSERSRPTAREPREPQDLSRAARPARRNAPRGGPRRNDHFAVFRGISAARTGAPRPGQASGSRECSRCRPVIAAGQSLLANAPREHCRRSNDGIAISARSAPAATPARRHPRHHHPQHHQPRHQQPWHHHPRNRHERRRRQRLGGRHHTTYNTARARAAAPLEGRVANQGSYCPAGLAPARRWTGRAGSMWIPWRSRTESAADPGTLQHGCSGDLAAMPRMWRRAGASTRRQTDARPATVRRPPGTNPPATWWRSGGVIRRLIRHAIRHATRRRYRGDGSPHRGPFRCRSQPTRPPGFPSSSASCPAKLRPTTWLGAAPQYWDAWAL